MEWEPGDRSNIEDDRGRSGIGGSGIGGIHIGIGGFLVLLLLSWATGTNLFSLLGTDSAAPPAPTETSRPVQASAAEEREVDFVDAVAGDVQARWQQMLGSRYEPTKVVLFRDSLRSGCGIAQSATGPFYCPSDRKVYLDLGFFDELARRFGAPGDFARAYVIAHEFGHHIQTLLNLTPRSAGPLASGPNSASVAIELQADCFAGVWGHAASDGSSPGRVKLEPGDLEQGLHAAAAIGDDRLQTLATGHVMPERFTHGTSAQRVAAFRRGFDSGAPRACEDTPRETR
jgi:predicted metalloprotease